MNAHPFPRPTAWRTFLYVVAGALFAVATAVAPAAAQDSEPDPTPTPEDDATGEDPPDTGGSGFGLDFGDTVTIDENGTVIWNQDADTEDAEEGTATPTAVPETGVEGTGTVDDGTSENDDTEEQPAGAGGGGSGDDPLNSADVNGTGNNLAMLGGILSAAIALIIGVVVFVRNRRAAAAELAVVEEVITPASTLMGEGPTVDIPAAYQGADDAGAYAEGGAAYAQHTEGGYEASEEPTAKPQPAARLDQLRSSMADLADKRLVEAGHDRAMAKKLEAAGSKMRPGEWIVMATAGTIAALLGATFAMGWLVGIVAAVLVAAGFWAALSRQEAQRQKLFAEALPETLGLLSGSLRGGLSMIQAIQTVADEADEPTAEEFQRVITETRLGRDLAVSFRDLASRMGSKDFEWVVTAIEIHREVGGDLAAILDRVGNTIRARNRVRGQVKSLSAEGRASGMILFILPPGMFFAISLLNREYINEMLSEQEGQIMLVVSGVLLLVGGAWLKRLARFVY